MVSQSQRESYNNIYTDLAVEANNLAVQKTGQEIDGVTVNEEKKDEMIVTRVDVQNESAGRAIGKEPGLYVTIESQQLREGDRVVQEKVSQALAEELMNMINFEQLGPAFSDPTILVVGLGNWNATPDALGPRVLNYIMVTRHLFHSGPPELRGEMRPVSALAPGVLGLTGIETAEIILGVVNQIKPDLVIAVDALAARNTDRLSTTLQLCNTGVSPGSGIGEKRFAVNSETLGIPVIAIGVPTVINAVTIARESIDKLLANNGFFNENSLQSQNLESSIDSAVKEVLQPFIGRLIVSPKETDELIQNVSKVIAGGINVALHQGIDINEVSRYL